MGRFDCVTCGRSIAWRGDWWRHNQGGDDHEAVPPPRTPCIAEPLARMLAVVTGETFDAWRERELVWPDAPPVAGLATIHLGGLVRWRVDRAPDVRGGTWVHADSSSGLVTVDPAAAWSILCSAGLASGPCPPGLTAVREVLRVALGGAADRACQERDDDGLAGGILSSGTARPPLSLEPSTRAASRRG